MVLPARSARPTRRGVITALTSAAGATVLAACAQPRQAAPPEQKPAGQVTVTGKLTVLQVDDYHPDHNKFIKEEIERFAREKNWPLDLANIAGFLAGMDIYQKLLAQKQAGQPPDFLFHSLSTRQLVFLKLLREQTAFVEDLQKRYGRVYPSARASQVIDGKWWSVPFYNRTDGFWAREDKFKAVGINIDKDLDTWDQAREACLKVSAPANQFYGWGLTVNRSGDGEFLVRTIIWSFGGALADTTGQIVTLNSPETIAAVTWLKETYTDPKWAPMLPPGVNSWTDPSNNEAWLAGQIAFTSNAGTLYAKAVFDKNPIAASTKLLPPPLGPAKQRFLAPSGHYFYFFDGSKNYDAARQLAEHLLSIDVQRVLWKTSPGYVVPAYEKWWDDPIIQQEENSRRFKPVALAEPPFPGLAWRGPITEASDAVGAQNVLTDMMGEVLAGKPVAQAVKDAHDRAVRIYKELGFKGA
jgi:multiple sugar transport system substrate-binding protein